MNTSQINIIFVTVDNGYCISASHNVKNPNNVLVNMMCSFYISLQVHDHVAVSYLGTRLASCFIFHWNNLRLFLDSGSEDILLDRQMIASSAG